MATVLLALVVADAHSYDRTPYSADGKPMSFHVHRARALIQTGYSLDRWQDKSPATIAERRAWRAHKRAVLYPPARFAITQYRAKMVRRFERHREAQLERDDCIPGVTVYSLGDQCLSIPAYIVACESRGSWSAYNPSGAASIYQIMPEHGRPWPVNSVADKRAHHRIAANLYAGGAGASNWVCST